MPPTDPVRPPRRSLGRGPGAAPTPPASTGAAPAALPEPRDPVGAQAPDAGEVDAVAVDIDEVEAAAEDTARAVSSLTGPTDDVPVDGVPVKDGPTEDTATKDIPTEDAPVPSDDGRFTVRLANFEGPFDLLLQLISKHKMDVTEVALSTVTDEFMTYIRAMGPDWDLDQTTEFLVVAATLLDLKAARLLPAAEVEDEADLALLEARDLLFARLLQYRAYKQVAEIFHTRLETEARRYPRTVGLEAHLAALLPEVVLSIGAEGCAALAVKAMQPRPRPQVYVEHIHAPLVSVQEQAGIVVARLRERGEVSFQVLAEDAADTLTVVARFLALLELYRERVVSLEQEEALGPLMVRWTAAGEDVEPIVTDEFDRAPEETA
ncbi:segregation/condensation protein A [Streptomyces sp. NPDC088725]|uniref:segregation/condensation protein A n=1 Tax=Streptomyces sp. NPDC088725 TaxID=3365873 RepID=UPI003827222E